MPTHSQGIIAKRVSDVFGVVVDGLSHPQICRYVAANCTWTASERTIDRHIARARKLMLEQGHADRQEIFAQSPACKQRLYMRAVMAGQLKTALAVQDSIDRMHNNYRDLSPDTAAVDLWLAAMKGEAV
jgi:hypothetical protein